MPCMPMISLVFENVGQTNLTMKFGVETEVLIAATIVYINDNIMRFVLLLCT